MNNTMTTPQGAERKKDKELVLAGLFDKDSDYDGMLGNAVQDLLDVFHGHGHSGFSAQRTAYLFYTLIKDGILIPLQGTDDEWNDVSDINGSTMYQNNRKGDVFKDGKDGKAYFLDAIVWKGQESGDTFTGRVEDIQSRQYVKFPFSPKTFYVDVIRDVNGNSTIKDREQLIPVFDFYEEYKPANPPSPL